MSWHYKFYAEGKQEVLRGIDVHMGRVDSDFLCELTTHMRQAVSFLNDAPGIGWVVEGYGHVGGSDGCNFTFKVEPINTTKNLYYDTRRADRP